MVEKKERNVGSGHCFFSFTVNSRDQYFWNLNGKGGYFEHRQRDFRVPVEISQVCWRYKALNFSLHCSIKYFKNNNCFPSILNLFFLLIILFWKNFLWDVQDSIHISDITKRNSNIHFILGNTGHAWREFTVILSETLNLLYSGFQNNSRLK